MFTKAQAAAVLKLVSRRWATLAVMHAGEIAEVGHPFPRSHYSCEAARKRSIALCNAERRALAGAIEAMTGREVPRVPFSEFIFPYQSPPGGPVYERCEGKPTYHRKHAQDVMDALAEEISGWSGK